MTPFLRTVLTSLLVTSARTLWMPPQPKQNVWVTIANQTGQEVLCLAMSSPSNPFSTCLLGIPLESLPCPPSALPCNSTHPRSYADGWDSFLPYFPPADLEPQERELLGSIRADWCIFLNWNSIATASPANHPVVVNSSLSAHRNASAWCHYTSPNISRWSNSPIQLPPGIFLIWGDRAWPSVASRLRAGPCTLGRLSPLAPTTSVLLQHRQPRRHKRMAHAFTKECDSNADFWNFEHRFFSSLSAPGVASAKALSTLHKLGCWLAKQTNATSLAISNLLLDVDSVRHATCQDRAAIDFLLLVHGHGCEDLEGMCCMNLSDHSQSIPKQLSVLQGLTSGLREEEGLGLDQWLKSLGLGPWVRDRSKYLLVLLGFVFLVMISVPCCLTCLQSFITRMTSRAFCANLLALKEEGGSVESIAESWLAEKGHVDTIPLIRLK
ncbi:uncharacterized protein LOC128072973 [Tympanuchus pallidicinctus]|uniref:uncharacterized protein LOC128072973 n=1 Tax=Tympanuchus pallidicinctus TaxID=109042 RepID=UPI00228733AF|nr:uncharacterized protein LOC128072973 [Tympanuchus pallidicinctus]